MKGSNELVERLKEISNDWVPSQRAFEAERSGTATSRKEGSMSRNRTISR